MCGKGEIIFFDDPDPPDTLANPTFMVPALRNII